MATNTGSTVAKPEMIKMLMPSVIRQNPGGVPDKALNAVVEMIIAAYKASISWKNPVPPPDLIYNIFNDFCAAEWEIERSQSPHLFPQPYRHWYPDAFMGWVYKELGDKSLQQRILWGLDIGPRMMELGKTRINALKDGVPWTIILGSSGSAFFFYRVISAFFYTAMKALARMGLPIKSVTSFLVYPALGATNSEVANQAILDIASEDWLKIGMKDLYSEIEKREIAQAEAAVNAEIQERHNEYRLEQERLNKRIASLEQFEGVLKGAAKPLEIMQAGTGLLAGLGKVPAWAYLAGGGLIAYLVISAKIK